MNAVASDTFGTTQIPLVEFLTNDRGTATLGFRIGGFNAGPDVLVAGHTPIANLVYDRLLLLPTLAWMRGRLTLVFLHEFEREGLHSHFGKMFDPSPDELLFLPYDLIDAHHAKAASEGYWTVLRLCARLGMVTGRGVPAAPDMNSDDDDA